MYMLSFTLHIQLWKITKATEKRRTHFSHSSFVDSLVFTNLLIHLSLLFIFSTDLIHYGSKRKRKKKAPTAHSSFFAGVLISFTYVISGIRRMELEGRGERGAEKRARYPSWLNGWKASFQSRESKVVGYCTASPPSPRWRRPSDAENLHPSSSSMLGAILWYFIIRWCWWWLFWWWWWWWWFLCRFRNKKSYIPPSIIYPWVFCFYWSYLWWW